jgi:hypothetical protein
MFAIFLAKHWGEQHREIIFNPEGPNNVIFSAPSPVRLQPTLLDAPLRFDISTLSNCPAVFIDQISLSSAGPPRLAASPGLYVRAWMTLPHALKNLQRLSTQLIVRPPAH